MSQKSAQYLESSAQGHMDIKQQMQASGQASLTQSLYFQELGMLSPIITSSLTMVGLSVVVFYLCYLELTSCRMYVFDQTYKVLGHYFFRFFFVVFFVFSPCFILLLLSFWDSNCKHVISLAIVLQNPESLPTF